MSSRRTSPAYEDVASKFFEHFMYDGDRPESRRASTVARASGTRSDGFYYDQFCSIPTGTTRSLEPRPTPSSGSSPSSRSTTIETRGRSPGCHGFRAPNGVVPATTAPTSPRTSPVVRDARTWGSASSSRSCGAAAAATASSRRVLDPESEFLSDRTACARLSKYHAEHPFTLVARRGGPPRSITSRRESTQRPRSAATPTGAGPCGCR